MRACILNSGIGKRMGELTTQSPKCMVQIADGETILSRQLACISISGITEVVITTGPFAGRLQEYAEKLNEERNLGLSVTYVQNPLYADTNYIYSIYLAKDVLQDDIVLMHGDLVYEQMILQEIIDRNDSVMTISSTLPLPEKDFKAVVRDGYIQKVGIEFFDHAYAAQPLYKMRKENWLVWLDQIAAYCEAGTRSCYAENAFNEISESCRIFPYDVKDRLCNEIDNVEDLETIRGRLRILRDI